MNRAVILLLAILLVPIGLGQDSEHGHEEGENAVQSSSGPLFLLTDGKFSGVLAGAASECIAIDAQNPSDISTWTTNLSSFEHHIESSTVTLSLALTNGAVVGNGFQIEASLIHPDGQKDDAQRTFSAGSTVNSPVSLVFEVNEPAEAVGDLSLNVSLTASNVGPLALTDVGIQCNHADSLLHSFEYVEFAMAQNGENGFSGDGEFSVLSVILISVAAAFVTLIAGILPLIGRALAPRRLHLFLGITAGLLLSIAIVDLIPEAIEGGGHATAWTLSLGLLVLFIVKHYAGDHDHGGTEADDHGHHAPDADDKHTDPHAGRFAMVAFGALMFHRLVDGLALPGAFAAGGSVGFAASGAILLHQFPDGLAAASVFLSAGWQKMRVLGAVAALAFATPVGSAFGLLFANISGALPHLLALAAATFIFIALAELLPELRAKKYRNVVLIGFLIGYALTFGLELVADTFGGVSHGP